MPPNISGSTECIDKIISEDEDSLVLPSNISSPEDQKSSSFENGLRGEKKEVSSSDFKQDLKWLNIVIMATFHTIAVYTLLTFPYLEKKMTFFYSLGVAILVNFGTTGGVHRLWTHRAYKAKWPLRVFLLYWYYAAGQKSVFDWVRDHRVHHKYSDTVADPHDSSRGFFYCHVGWLLMKKHPEVIRRGRQIDMRDIVSDPIVAFGDRYFFFFKILCCFVLPTLVPVYLWNEEWYYAIMMQILRYIYTLHVTWSVNSAAHIWGTKPYDKTIASTQNKLVSFLASGEGWHNYHHVFPWDYKAAELGNYELNFTTLLLDIFAKIGWAYDLKQPSKELIRAIYEKRGDGSHIDLVLKSKSH